MPRRRSPNNWGLPPYVYLVNGRYVLKPYLGKGKTGTPVRLGPADLTLTEVHEAYEAVKKDEARAQDSALTLGKLMILYQASERHQALADGTKRNNGIYAKSIATTKLKGGKTFGDILARDLTTPAIRKYMDSTARKRGKVTANRHYSFLQQSYKWAVEYGRMPATPCTGIKKFTEKARDRYVADWEYRVVRRRAPDTMKLLMELGYLCRLRPTEARLLKKSDWIEAGLRIDRLKGSKAQVIGRTRRLERVIALCQALPGSDESELLVCNRKGQSYTASGVASMFQTLIKKAAEDGAIGERFTMQDLKAKGVSDFTGDKFKASGHKTFAMTAVYDRKLEVVPATN